MEILHVILLSFVKYFWRDAIKRLKDPDKKILIARLASFDVSGLGISPLPAATFVNYAGSLVGCNFCAIAQVATFVLHGFGGIPPESIKAWTALSRLVPLVWTPGIHEIGEYLVSRLRTSITFENLTQS